jgi:hypothetical protein
MQGFAVRVKGIQGVGVRFCGKLGRRREILLTLRSLVGHPVKKWALVAAEVPYAWVLLTAYVRLLAPLDKSLVVC